MSEKAPKPAVFRLNQPDIVATPPSDAPVPARADDPVAALAPTEKSKPGRWLALFWTGLSSIVALALGLAATRLVEDLFARHAVLGWIGVAAVAAAGIGGALLCLRELLALRRLARFDRLRAEAELALAEKDDKAALKAADQLVAMLAQNPRMAAGRAAYGAAIADGVVDGAQRLRLIERTMIEPIDREATRLVAEAARRVSVVTAVSPKAAVDLAMVLFTAVQLIRRLAELYGGRPGALGLWRLSRHVATHMAITGGMAAGDTILDQIVGHGLAAKLSAKLGEGVLNGLLTARLGVTAISVTRPLPYIGAPRPDLRDLAGDAFSAAARGGKT